MRKLTFTLFAMALTLSGAATNASASLASTNLAATEHTQQQISIKGTVVDTDKQPVIGAVISIEGTTKGTSSDVNGAFALSAPAGATLVVRSMGYVSERIAIEGRTTINIVLQADVKVLDEAVVVGYGVQKRENLSGAVATIDPEVLEDRPVMTVGQALQGTIANLNITVPDGAANVSPTFNVRGYNSINGGEPLIIIDGVVSDASMLNRLNPADIASGSVLKDAASSAIYGSRAAYGVILITTKKGKLGKTVVNYNSNIVARTRTNTPDLILDPYMVATTKDQLAYPTYSDLYNEEQLKFAKEVSEGSRAPYWLNPDGSYTYFGSTDWTKETYKEVGFSTQHNVSLSGATEALNYYLSSSYDFQDGMVKYGSDTYNRYNVRSKLDMQVTPWLSISNNTSYVESDYDKPEALDSDFYWSVYRTNSLAVPTNPDGSWTYNGASNFGLLQEGGRRVDTDTDFNSIFSSKVNLIGEELVLNGNFSYQRGGYDISGHTLPVYYTDGVDRPMGVLNENTKAYTANSTSTHTTYDVYANYNKQVSKHNFNAMVGFNQEEYRYDYRYMSRTGLISESLPSLDLATGVMDVDQDISTWTTRGAFARAAYNYDSKYLVEFNGRYDGTSRFSKESRYVFSPSGSAAWVISRENFFEPLRDVVSFLKLRYSYGTLGNQDVSEYAYLATMGSGQTSQILDGERKTYVSAPGLITADLTWEKVTTSDIGLDLYMFDNRFSLTADYYVRATTDMLTTGTQLPEVLGTAVPLENAADLETKGWELTVGWKDQFKLGGKPFKYDLSFNIGDSRTFITRFDNPTGSLNEYYVGMELGEMWGLTTDGFFASYDDIANSADQSAVQSDDDPTLAPGDLKFKDINGDGKINDGDWTLEDPGDYQIIGNSRPRYNYGMTANFQWNGFDLGIILQGVGKQNYYPHSNDLYFWGTYSQPWTNTTVHNYYDRWSEENPDGYFPRQKAYVVEDWRKEANAVQTRYIQDASYLRIKNLTIGYTLPKLTTQKMGIERLRVYLSADNLATISGLYNNYIDPEALSTTGGGSGMKYPQQRYFSFGINLTF